MATAMIVLAGGSGSRIDSEVNKVYLPVAERPILSYSLTTFAASPFVDDLVLVIRGEDHQRAEGLIAALETDKPIAVVTGGSTRQESERAGLEHLAPQIDAGYYDLIAIHDGARPFVSLDMTERLITAARLHGGAIPALSVEQRMYVGNGVTARPLPADGMVRVQTPQAFWAAPLLAAYRSAARAGFAGVDTAETVERFSDLTVMAVDGDGRNIKITFVEDFFAAEDLAVSWMDGRFR